MSLGGIDTPATPPPLPVPPPFKRGRFYRGLSRFRLHWLVVSGLFVFWASGVYDGYFGEAANYVSPDTEELSMRCLDRGMRLNDEAEKQSAFVKWLLYHSSREEGLRDAEEGLLALRGQNLLDETGTDALAVVQAELGEGGVPPGISPLAGAALEGKEMAPGDLEKLAEKLKSGEASWWETQIAGRLAEESDDASLRAGLAVQERMNRTLLGRVFYSYTLVWLVVLAGLGCLPSAWRTMRAGWRENAWARPGDYPSRWSVPLVIGLFLASDLTGNLFISSAYLAVMEIETGFAFDVVVDTLWRFIPPVIAMAVLFRSPRHLVKSIGLRGPVRWSVVFGVFTVLSAVDLGLYHVLGDFISVDPTGGLSMMEAGGWGLFYGVLSACIAAPVAEEFLYRGLLLRGLSRSLGFCSAAVIATLVFTLAHYYDVYGLVSVGIFGFATAMVYRATGSLSTAIVLHALYNLTITVPNWLMYHSELK